MKLISPKDARAIALKSEIKIVKKRIKRSAKCGNACVYLSWALFPEVISMLEEAGYTVDTTYMETAIYWNEEKK